MKIYIKSMIVIVAICLVMGTVLAAVYKITAPIIAENEKKNAQAALYEIFPEAKKIVTVFDESNRPAGTPESIREMYSADGTNNFVLLMSVTTTYSTAPLTFAIGFDGAKKEIVKMKILSYNETVSFGDQYPKSYAGQDSSLADVASSASPAKYSRAAVRQATETAFDYLDSINWTYTPKEGA